MTYVSDEIFIDGRPACDICLNQPGDFHLAPELSYACADCVAENEQQLKTKGIWPHRVYGCRATPPDHVA